MQDDGGKLTGTISGVFEADMASHVMAVKTLSIKVWDRTCRHCGEKYDIEERDARMAPGVELVVHLDFELQFKIGIDRFGGQKSVGGT